MTRPDVTAMADWTPIHWRLNPYLWLYLTRMHKAGGLAREVGDRLLAARMRHHGITRAENA